MRTVHEPAPDLIRGSGFKVHPSRRGGAATQGEWVGNAEPGTGIGLSPTQLAVATFPPVFLAPFRDGLRLLWFRDRFRRKFFQMADRKTADRNQNPVDPLERQQCVLRRIHARLLLSNHATLERKARAHRRIEPFVSLREYPATHEPAFDYSDRKS